MARPSVAVVIPVFNEEQSLPLVLGEIPSDLVDEIVVVDNGSTDRSADVARANGAQVVTEPERGYGAACLKGIAAAAGFDVLVFLDGDFSDHPGDMRALLAPIVAGDADFVVGTRMLDAASRRALLPQARFGNRLATFLMRLLYGIRCSDLGPFRAIRSDALARLGMQDRTFGWTVEMQLRAHFAGLRVLEVPVRYRERVGVSKITGTLRGTVLAGYKILGTILAYRVRPPRLPGIARGASNGRRRLRAAGAAALGIALFAEALLQVGHYFSWQSQWIQPGEPRASVVLCVGGDVTFGAGAPERSAAYPARLEGLLRESDPSARVLNGGGFGRSSADVARRLPFQLNAARPGRVVVLVGGADLARDSGRVDASSLGAMVAPFRWRLRIAEWLGSLFSGGAGPERGGERPFVGEWHAGSIGFSFEPDGRARLGAIDVAWTSRDGQVVVTLPNGEGVDVDWGVRDGQLHLMGGFPGGEVCLDPGPPLSGPAASAAYELERGRIDVARWMLEVARRGARPTAEVVAALAEVAALAGDRVGARAFRREVEGFLERVGTDVDARFACRARLAVGDVDAALRLGLPALERHLLDAGFLAAVATRRFAPKDRARVLEAARRARRDRAPDDPVVSRAWLLESWQLAGIDPDAAQRALVRSLGRWDAPPALVPEQLWPTSGDRLRAALEAVELPAAPRAAVEERHARDLEALARRVSDLEHNLRLIVGLCRSYGAEPLLVTSPLPAPAADEAVRSIALDLAVRVVDVAGAFGSAELVGSTRTLTGRGYARLANAVRERLN